ncbi:MAG TPA: hypothetical protein VHW09_01610 [Bryobacteraceae bacterium]|jgi:hypothetical protein|nr:hypothetical protein [Bryobacteraceae bacterium]
MPACLDWLLESDPAIRWQAMRDLTAADPAAIAAERSRVASQGWAARLLALQGADGSWGDGVSRPKWHATLYTLRLLCDLGLDPASEQARRAVDLVRERFGWGAEFGDATFFEGEVEPCINGVVLTVGAYFGEASGRLADRLLGEQLEDGGWNCSAPKSRRSSFHTTICVLEGLLEYQKRGSVAVTDARLRGQEYLLKRGMFKRLSTGEPVNRRWTRFSFPPTWHYDILRGLDYLRSAGVEPDQRVAEAVELVAAARRQDGRWLLHHPQVDPPCWWRNPIDFELEGGEGSASRWNTLRALRVLRWYRHSDAAVSSETP